MNCKKEDLLLYGITDRSWLNGKTLYSQVEGALKGGVTFLQLREKSLDQAHFRQEAAEIRKLCKKYGVPLIINDNVRIAKEIDADGVHVGQGDMKPGQCENCWEQIKSSVCLPAPWSRPCWRSSGARIIWASGQYFLRGPKWTPAA